MAYQVKGAIGKYCDGETKLDGWTNLRSQTGSQVVWIKGMQCNRDKNPQVLLENRKMVRS